MVAMTGIRWMRLTFPSIQSIAGRRHDNRKANDAALVGCAFVRIAL